MKLEIFLKIQDLVRRRFNKVIESQFLRNAAKLSSGTMISQLIVILTSPILTRIYSPSDYGAYGIVLSISTLVSVFVTLSYVNAIVISKDEKELNEVIALCLKNVLAVFLLSLFIIIILNGQIAQRMGLIKTQELLYFIPFSVLMNGINVVFTNASTKQGFFKLISINRVISALAGVIISIGLGIIFHNVKCLLAGLLTTQLISSIFLFNSYKSKKRSKRLHEYFKIHTKDVAKLYAEFPKFTLPSDFINIFSNQIPIFVITTYSPAPESAVGHYNMSNRMLGLPVTILSASIGDVFRQRAAIDYHENGTCRPIFLKTLKTLTLFAVMPFGILIFYGSDIFSFVFGQRWRPAGEYSQILGIMFFFRFIISPLTYVFFIANKQKLDFVLHLLFILVGFLSLYIGMVIFNNIYTSLYFFSISYSLIYILYLYFSYNFSNKIK